MLQVEDVSGDSTVVDVLRTAGLLDVSSEDYSFWHVGLRHSEKASKPIGITINAPVQIKSHER